MGITHLNVQVSGFGNGKRRTVKMLVDSGAVYSVLPANLLTEIGVKPESVETFFLADGTEIRRKIGSCRFKYLRWSGPGKVVFGEKGDSRLLGVTTIENMGLLLDPIRRELRPIKLFLA